MASHPASYASVPLARSVPEGLPVAQLRRAMRIYEFVFNPVVFSAGAVLVLVVYEWRRNSGDRSELWTRLGAVLGVMVLGTMPALVYVLLQPVGVSAAFVEPPWQVDVVSTFGQALTAVLIWGIWRYFDWGDVLPGGALVILGVLVPYSVVAPVWNVSGHVTFTTAVALYLAYVDRRMAPVLLFPPVTVFNRIYLDAHTPLQSVAGVVLALVVVGAIVVFVMDDGIDPTASERPVG